MAVEAGAIASAITVDRCGVHNKHLPWLEVLYRWVVISIRLRKQVKQLGS
ncbi:hypothetical protein [Synechococcus sp. M16CYN]